MLKELRQQPRAIIFAVLVHLVLLAVLVFSFDWTPKTETQSQGNVIQAQVVDESRLHAAAQRRRQQDEVERRRKEEEQQAADQRRVDEKHKIEEKQRAETQRITTEKLRQGQETKQRLAERKKKQQESEHQRLEEQQRLAAEQERRRKDDMVRKQAEADAKRKAEDDRRRAEDERRRQEDEHALKEQMAAEQARLDAEKAKREAERARLLTSLLSQYINAIAQKVNGNWLRPPGAGTGLHCKVHVVQLPGGIVRDAAVSECNGDAAFKRSVEAAVLKSSPMPLPSDQALFDRDLVFEFRPKD